MFERYTEKARRVIFFARYEASQFGAQAIDAEHILLGVLREDKQLVDRFLGGQSGAQSIRKRMEAELASPCQRTPASVDLPLSASAKRVLGFAADESDRLGRRDIGTEHLLLGILCEGKATTAHALNELGVSVEQVRGELAADWQAERDAYVEKVASSSVGGSPGATEAGDRNQSVAGILEQLGRLTEVLIRRGVFSDQEVKAVRTESEYRASFSALIELLARKAVITEDERRQILGLNE